MFVHKLMICQHAKQGFELRHLVFPNQKTKMFDTNKPTNYKIIQVYKGRMPTFSLNHCECLGQDEDPQSASSMPTLPVRHR